MRDGQKVRVTYTDANPTAVRRGTASVNCKPYISAGGVLFAQFGKDAFTLVDGGCERDDRQPVGYFTFGFPDRYMDDGELVTYLLAFQSAEIGTDLLNVSVSLKAVNADTDSPASCKMGSAPTTGCPDPNRTNNTCASSHPNANPPIVCGTAAMSILDSPKVYGRVPSATTLTPSFTIQATMADGLIHKVDMIIGVTALAAGKGVETKFAKREVMNVDEVATYYSTDFPTGGVATLDYDVNNNEILESATYAPRDFLTDYFVETRAYSDLTSTNPTLIPPGAPWNFDTNDGGFRSGLNNTSRPQPLSPMAQWGEDKNFNGALDGFCTGNHAIPCTQGIAKSVGCRRCSLNSATECLVDTDCDAAHTPLGDDEGICSPAVGTCDFTLGEDRNTALGTLDKSWNTLGGCGWQTKAPGATGGGVWHTGLIKDPASSSTCVAAGAISAKCQQYWVQDDGDTIGDNNWWELLLTPVLHKVHQAVDSEGDPVYQAAITDWAWNMLVDLPDTNTQVTLEFDTDINKTAGAELFNDAAILVQFRGKQGAVSGGNGPITNGFNMFHRINHCVDTDGNGSVDHCGTASAKLCSGDGASTPSNFLCDGNDTRLVRGLCTTPTTLPGMRCTGNPAFACTTNTECNRHCAAATDRVCLTNSIPAVGGCSPTGTNGACIDNHVNGGETCVRPWIECSTNTDCSTVGGTCAIPAGAALAANREGSNNCYFYGIGNPVSPNQAKSQEPYGLPTPPDDDAANGYCSRSDGFLTGLDKSASCESANDCESAGPPYASIRKCSLWKTCSIATGKGCLTNTDCTLLTEGTCDTTKPKDCAKDSPDCGPAVGVPPGTGTPVGGTCTGSFGGITYTAVCNLPNSVADEYVKKNGPGRNYGIQVSNGPDMRFSTLEDIYGDTGNDFQAALGFNNREPDPITRGVPAGYGLAVDDMVISWKESTLSVDSHTCGAAGECATLDSASTLSYEGNSVVSLTLIDKTPYDAVNPKNDCNGDGDYIDAGDDQDCNNNGALDVVVGMTSAAETVPELAILDETSPGSHVYKANFPYSTLYNSPGTLFVVQSGTALPTVTARYLDRNDGTGSLCKNAVDPVNQGSIISTTTVAATTGLVTLNSYSVKLAKVCSGLTSKACNTDLECSGFGTCTSLSPGDDDGFADASELINLAVVLANKSGLDLEDVTATLGTTSPNIECITRASIFVGPVLNKALSNPANYLPFQFKVKDTVNRVDPFQTLQATFTITLRSNKFDALTRSTSFTIDLDLNASGGGNTIGFNEGFETPDQPYPGDFGKFTREYLDANKRSRVLSKGFRCQYNNPFGVNSQSASNTDCFLGFTADPSSGKNDWHVHTTVEGRMGRALLGVKSLHLGVHLEVSNPSRDTTRNKHVMSVRTINPINIPLAGASPQLNFAQQVSFVDSSAGVNVSPGEGVDRGVVEVQRTLGGVAQGSWIKIYPFENGYDEQGTDDFSNCVFDPTDDGNTETDFFDPGDPNRRLGPSSTCFPEFCFVHQGQTDYRKRFDQTDIGNASDGPGLQGCFNTCTLLSSRACTDNADCSGFGACGTGCLPPNTTTTINNPGTWVRPRFDLSAFAANSLNLRFLFSSIEIGSTEYMDGFFGRPDLSGDDGWYIDDINIAEAIDTPLTLSTDTATIASPLPCGACGTITAVLDATPASLPAPGQIVTLTAKQSTADKCINGILQYQFWNDVNGNGPPQTCCCATGRTTRPSSPLRS